MRRWDGVRLVLAMRINGRKPEKEGLVLWPLLQGGHPLLTATRAALVLHQVKLGFGKFAEMPLARDRRPIASRAQTFRKADLRRGQGHVQARRPGLVRIAPREDARAARAAKLVVTNARSHRIPSRARRSRFGVRIALFPYGPQSSTDRSSAMIRTRLRRGTATAPAAAKAKISARERRTRSIEAGGYRARPYPRGPRRRASERAR